MFQTFVTGPIGARGFGLVGRCVECRAQAGAGEFACTGFGAGCLTRPAREPQEARGFAWASLIDVDPRLTGF